MTLRDGGGLPMRGWGPVEGPGMGPLSRAVYCRIRLVKGCVRGPSLFVLHPAPAGSDSAAGVVRGVGGPDTSHTEAHCALGQRGRPRWSTLSGPGPARRSLPQGILGKQSARWHKRRIVELMQIVAPGCVFFA